jgi:hypothetical protein
MKKVLLFSIIFVFVCSIFLCGCISSTYTKPTATPTTAPEITSTPAVTVTIVPTALPTPPENVNSTTTSTPVPSYMATPTAGPTSAPIYTVSCTFTGLILNSTRTVVTGISGNLTNVYTEDRISGNVNSDAYQFSHVSSGSYDMVIDVQYTVYYSNNSTGDRSTRITDSFDVNGNVDRIYSLF